ncbi:hypothetical protein [Microbacterium sp. CIAB417]|uniref:SecDF P1 head subdomain-containing protein n=1 Tax=Microbacterium sp. CIAB417 TaxID=2860287 RepID=UPI001FAE71AB|nr:hypothetical protein [Microbacterium sp. CIAB417]
MRANRTIGLAIMAITVTVGTGGCALIAPEVPMAQIVLEAPPGTEDARDLAAALEERLEALDAAHAVEVDGTAITIDYEAGAVPGGDELFTAGGATSLRPVLADDAAATTPCADAAAEEPCSGTDPGSSAPLRLGPSSPLGIADATADLQDTNWVIEVDFTESGAGTMQELSAAAACAQGQENRIAMVLDGEILTAPSVAVGCGESLESELVISGGFDRDDAMLLAAVLASPIPAGVTVVEQSG